MFKEDYIKDNNQIKPDEDFLMELKKKVTDEEIKMAEDVREQQTATLEESAEEKETVLGVCSRPWLKWAVLTACGVLLLVAGVMFGDVELGGDGTSLKGDMKAVLRKETEDDSEKSEEYADAASRKENNSSENADAQKRYEKVIRLFQKLNVVIYEIQDFSLSESDLEYLKKNKETSNVLDAADRDDLVGSILAEKYELVETIVDFSESKYYIAEFEDGSVCRFAIGDGEYIYIDEVSGVQNVAEVAAVPSPLY